jgi:hypothetical protein
MALFQAATKYCTNFAMRAGTRLNLSLARFKCDLLVAFLLARP